MSNDEDRKVLSIYGGEAITPGEPDERIVDELEERLAQAKAGRIKALAIACVIEDGSALPLPSRFMRWDTGYFRHLLFSFMRLKMQIESECDE